jgi:hypothetical protein
MRTKSLLSPIFEDEAITRGLGDAEARILIEWLVEQVDNLDENDPGSAVEVRRLCRWARSVGRFVFLWCHQRLPGPALQLAAVERFPWPMPEMWLDPCELMEHILSFEAVAKTDSTRQNDLNAA